VTPPSQPGFTQGSAPAPQPIPLGAAAVQNTPQAAEPTTQYSVDYLNQIAPTQKKSTNRFAVIALIAGVLLATIVAVFVLANAGPPDFSTQAKGVQARITTLQTVADGQQTHLNENAISEANSSLSSALTSMNTELSAIMKAKGLKATDAAKATVTKTEKTYAIALVKKLDDSYQRGTLDRTYAAQMTYELTVLRSQLNRMKNTANSKSVTAYVDSAVTNIDAILKAYDAFSATK
jgi:hypothetical protein